MKNPEIKLPPPVKNQLVGQDGNAFALMGTWQRKAKKAGWTNSECAVVTEQCMSGDYDNLLNTLMKHSR